MARTVGKVVGALVAVAVVAIGVAYAQGTRRLSAAGIAPRRPALTPPSDSAALERGERLAVTHGCTECHGASLGGTIMVDDPAFGRLVATNLTTGAGGVLARYDDRALDAAIRDGVAWNGRKLVIMPSQDFAGMADEDVAALIAIIRRRTPVNNVLPPVNLGPLGRALVAAGAVPLANDIIDHSRTTIAVAPRGGTVEQGRYLAANCMACHGANLAGTHVPGTPMDSKPSANITPAGAVGHWTQAEFVRLMREGVRPAGDSVAAQMPWRAFSRFTDEELQALYRYLRTVPPVTPKTTSS